MTTSLIHSLIRFYCKHSPFELGKGFLQKRGRAKLLRDGDTIVQAHSIHDVMLELHFPEDAGWELLFYRNTFETGTTKAFIQLIRDGDTMLDIGANLGWYSILCSKHAKNIYCHAFEPIPAIMNRFQRNAEINNVSSIRFNNFALSSDIQHNVPIYSFEGLYHGHSSMSSLDRNDYTTTYIDTTTLDAYYTQQSLSKIDIIKMDTEGAELEVLKGSTTVLSHPEPPIWIIELNTETSKSFGHQPHDVLDYLQKFHAYYLLRVVRGWDSIVPMKNTHDYSNGDNAICIPLHRKDEVNALLKL